MRQYWTVSAEATNATATATVEGLQGRVHIVTGVVSSYSTSVSDKLVDVLHGSTDLVPGTPCGVSIFPSPAPGQAGESVSASLPPGGIGIVGKVTLFGYTL